MDKRELDERVAAETEGLHLNVITRSGCTHDATSLMRVAAQNAKYVIWLEPSEEDITLAAGRACSIATLKALGAGMDTETKIVVQTSNDSKKSVNQLTDVNLAYRMPPSKKSRRLDVVEMYEGENFDRLLAQCALQPGLSPIISHILQHGKSSEFYIWEGTRFEGKTYSYARRFFDSAIVCGIYTPNVISERRKMKLNPPEDTVLEAGDQLILLCRNKKKAIANAEPLPPSGSWISDLRRTHIPCSAQDIVILCFGPEEDADSGLIKSICQFAPTGTNITVVSR